MRKYFLLFVLLLISAGFRFINLGNRGLFTDEKFTMLNANGIWVGGGNQVDIYNQQYFTPADFWKTKKINDYFEAIAHSDFGTHIVYNGIVHYWMQLFGNSDFSVRFLSAIFSLITVLLVFLLVSKYLKNNTAAFFAGLLLALDPLNIAQSHIARSYTLSFLIMVLSTIYFLKILNSTKNTKYFIVYALLVGLGMLNHYLNFLVPLCHALVFLVLKNKKHLWCGFIGAALFNVLLMLYWFNWGGGYLAMEFLKDKNEKHLEMAKGALDGIIELSTPEIVTKKTLELFFDSSVLSQGLFTLLNGVKNVGISLLVFLSLLGAYFFKKNKKVFGLFFIPVLLLLGAYPYLFNGILVACFLYFVLFLGLKYTIDLYKKTENRAQFALMAVCLLMIFLPILFVVNDALSNGHTTSLTHRYIGVASPFVAIFIGVSLSNIIKQSSLINFLLVCVCLIQYKPVKKEIWSYFEDKSLMNAYFEPSRIENPYAQAAKSIMNTAQKSDTLIIPGGFKNVYMQAYESKVVKSYLDAQFLNVYFPKDFYIMQKIDAYEKDKIYLKKENGEKVLIFDFQGTKYRY
ncbi:DUF2723 domain-containing protein [Lacihabitans sp. LS3-19]|uniref:glycosyltransferase family 39 protein n=1 Tax=Lacihabitans sp. LS3-19 TaxID=2487335 RepID=UPI0020CF0678|nr:glycosyltransferase family 39 protein [Lacihabitans sp. LS3-19]MCP9771000.1 DUF2723 domain-containing protein [Lacihabitans sp. LS3-19]